MTRHALSGTTSNFDLADNLRTAITMMIDTTLNIRVSIIAVIGINIAKDTTDLSAFTIVFAFKSYRKFIQIFDQISASKS